ncbi:MAG TPA: RbsD/FucU family protein [Tepidisphaeraceae bacterium]|jgi:L-fucose mutarotase
MLQSQLLHPYVIAALAKAGHGSQVLISDGNYPHWTKRGANAEVVYLNLAPGQLTVTDVLKVLISAIPIEAADVMDYARTGQYALKEDPPIWNEFRQILHDAKLDLKLGKIERFKFYDAAGSPDVCLTIATGEQRIYANILLTIGVVKPKE